MSVQKPKFIDSPYFVDEEDNWHLKEGAPPEVIQEFEEFMKYYRDMEEKGVAI